ncbi:protein-serine/threonine phosphatase [Malassezia yamatoensis]|uniref:protein-serine/threonine phosphatase n=1 Tax=Malassezia yamatoensis TaxID=253288 RepID=A0AAJ5YR44_9BASI|nr:protein-serine/threonine phosphatase [Malassezia yamatoensis]
MGQILSEPIVDKRTSRGEDERHAYCVSDMQGWRISMEDAHAAILNLPDDANVTPDQRVSFFAVYDGHGGANVARYAGRTLHGRLAELPEFQQRDWEAALRRAFLKTDEDLRVDPVYANDTSGCTAVAALIVPVNDQKSGRRIYCANSGDSRCVLGLSGGAKPLSYDHKPSNPDEHSRILNAGGFVEFDRVNGNLALSRALGDFEFKQNSSLPAEEQIVTADPQVISHDFTGEEEFLILACDGIWDCLSNQQVVDLVRRGVAQGKDLDVITEDIIDRCLAPDAEVGGIGCDNMTLLIVALLGNRTKDQWYQWVQQRVDNKVGYDTPESVPPVFRSHLQQSASSPTAPNNENTPQRNAALSFNRLGSGSLLSAIPRVLAGQNASEEDLQADDEDQPGEISGSNTGKPSDGSLHQQNS